MILSQLSSVVVTVLLSAASVSAPLPKLIKADSAPYLKFMEAERGRGPLSELMKEDSAPRLKFMEAERGRSPQDFPQYAGFVNDFAGVIDPEVEARLTALCTELEEKTTAELAVVTVPTVGDYEYAEYANRLFEKWRIGKKGKDNGVLLFVTVQERRVKIETGYGVEGILPDITTGHILDDHVVAPLRHGDYGTGLLRGAEAIAGIIAADAGVEITGALRPNPRRSRSRESGGVGKLLVPLLIFLFLVRPRWLLPFLMMSGGRRRGGWGGGFGGGFGGGGFGGGGFGGFGGGGSGGGGAGRAF